jgi:4-amino-4-deoxy-L-arabinose transferase-like glycosyltransferase
MNNSLVRNIEQRIEKHPPLFYAVMCVLIAAISLTGLNGSLQNMDECLYANIARETMENRSVIPIKEGQYYVHKSPLMFWTAILSFRIFGVNDFAAKFPSAVANIITALMLLFISRKVFRSSVAGAVAVFIYLTSLQVYGSSHQLATDSLMVMALITGLYFVLKGIDEHRLWILVAAGFNAMAFLTKSVMGLIVPATLFLSIVVQKRWDLFLFFIFHVLISLAVALPYFSHVYIKAPELFMQTFVQANLLGRIRRTDGAMLKHAVDILFAGAQYVVLVLVFLLPFSAGVIPLFFQRGKEEKNARLLWGELSKPLSLYFLVVLAGFAVSSANGVWPHYTLPMMPAASLFVGASLSRVRNKNIFLGFTTTGVLVLTFLMVLFFREKARYPTYKDFVIGLSAVCAIFATTGWLLYRRDAKPVIGVLFQSGLYFFLFTILTAVSVPLDFNADIKSFAEVVYEKPSPMIIINTKEVNEGSKKTRPVYWYMRMEAKEYRTLERFLKDADKVQAGTSLLFYKKYESRLKNLYPSFEVLQRGKIWSIGLVN